MDRCYAGRLDDVGLGSYTGLNMYRYDFVGLLMHGAPGSGARVGPHTIRTRPAHPAGRMISIPQISQTPFLMNIPEDCRRPAYRRSLYGH